MALPFATGNLRHDTIFDLGRRILPALLRFEAWLDARRSRRALATLDERALKDLGLTQDDLGRPDPSASWQALLLPGQRG